MKFILNALPLLLATPLVAATNNPNTDWFATAGFGVFVHFLAKVQNNPVCIQSLGRETSWDECVRGFEVERFAHFMEEAGAGYVIFTVNQQTRFLIAPNAAFDRITGYATQIRITLSADRKTWQTVAAADNLEGQPYAAEFNPVKAQFVRVSALKPNGPDQKGAQMAVAELEVYE